MSKYDAYGDVAAVLQNVPPPRVLLGVVDADVIGHDVDDQAHAACSAPPRTAAPALGAAERGGHVVGSVTS